MPIKPVIRVQRDDFDIAREIELATAGHPGIGAVVTFSGICRDDGGSLAALELEHYPGMAERAINEIALQAAERWPLQAVTAIHRYGRVLPGENIVLVLAASAHRQAAFDGAAFLMDFLKSKAPFWKKLIAADGSDGGWVDAKESDDEALQRWSAAEGFERS
jgi:molybdopterin synthase catalytic subunit